FQQLSAVTGIPGLTQANYTDYMVGSGLSTANYDTTLTFWSAQDLESGVVFDAGTSKYCLSEAQHQSIITNFSWTINDAGKDCGSPPRPFIIQVKTDNPGTTSNNQFLIPTDSNYIYNYNVDCNND